MIKKLYMTFMALFVFGSLALAAERSYTGVVSDDHCKAKHSEASDQAAECVKKCVGMGSKYVLVSGKRVYNLDPQDKFADFAGKKVKVTGALKAGTITASNVAEAPAVAKKGGGKKKKAEKAG